MFLFISNDNDVVIHGPSSKKITLNINNISTVLVLFPFNLLKHFI